MSAESEHKRRYMTPKEYMDVQRERGGCTEDFKETMKRSATLGLTAGIPFGAYVAYMYVLIFYFWHVLYLHEYF